MYWICKECGWENECSDDGILSACQCCGAPPSLRTPDEMYQHGREYYQNRNYSEAVRWYRKAAEQGHARAQLDLGFAYENGMGVEKYLVEAAMWFRKAAEQGYAPAQDRMAYCYEKGLGVERNLEKAVEWCKRACQQDFPGSTRHLHQLELLLSEERPELFPALSSQEFGILNDVLVKYNGSAPNVVVPGGVKRIGARAFENNRSIRSVILPDKLLGIGVDAFAGCANLQEVVVPGSVVALNLECFGGCSSLKKLVLQPGVQKLIFGEKLAQLRCLRIEVPNTVTSVTWSSMGADERNIRMNYPKKIFASGKWGESFQRFFAENPDFTHKKSPTPGEPKYLLFRAEHSKQERQLLILGWICLLASAMYFVYACVAAAWIDEVGYIGGLVLSFLITVFFFFFPVLRKQLFLLNRLKTWKPTKLGWRIAYSIWDTIESFFSFMAVGESIFIPIFALASGEYSMLWFELLFLPFGIYHVCWRRWWKKLEA